jgi:hypothetical protein
MLLLAAALPFGAPLAAAICNVPAGQATVGAAIANPSCSEIVLAAQSFNESPSIARSLTLRGAGVDLSVIEGKLSVSGAGVLVELRDLTVDAAALPPGDGLAVAPGAEVALRHVEVFTASSNGIYTDGFESGTTSAWSSTVP